MLNRQKSLPKNSNALGYGLLIGGIMTNAAASAGITVWVNPHTEFVPTFIGFSLGQVTFIAASFLSPFSEPISSKIRRFSFALKGRSQKETSEIHQSHLETKADVISATYTLREQHAIDRIFTFRNSLRLNFQNAALAFENGDDAKVAAEIADAAMVGYLYFQDIDPRESAIVNTIHASFLVNVEFAPDLKNVVLEKIRDRSLDWDDQAEIYYQRALDAWLGV